MRALLHENHSVVAMLIGLVLGLLVAAAILWEMRRDR